MSRTSRFQAKVGKLLGLLMVALVIGFTWGFTLMTITGAPAEAQTSTVAGRYAGVAGETGSQLIVTLTLTGADDELDGFLSVFSEALATTLIQDTRITGRATASVVFLTINNQGISGLIVDSSDLSFDLGEETLRLVRLPDQLDETYTGRLLSGLELLEIIVDLSIANDVVESTINVLEMDGTVRIGDAEAVIGFSPSGAIEINELIIDGAPSNLTELGVLLNGGESLLFRDLGQLTQFAGAEEIFRSTVADLSTDPMQIITADGDVIEVTATTSIQDESGIIFSLIDLTLGTFIEIRGRRLPLGNFSADLVIILSEDQMPGDQGGRVVTGAITAVRMGGGTDLIITIGSLDITVSESTPVARNDGAVATTADLMVGQSVRIDLGNQSNALSVLILGQGEEADQPNNEQLVAPDEADEENTEMDDPG